MTPRRHRDRKPTHPGELLREVVLPSLNRPKAEIARLLDISRESLYRILDERQPVTPPMAVKLGKLCGNGPHLWLQMQANYDLWQAQRDVDVTGISTLDQQPNQREPPMRASSSRPWPTAVFAR